MSSVEAAAAPRGGQLALLAAAAAALGLASATMGAAVILAGLTVVAMGFVFAYPREAAIPVALLSPVANLAVLKVPGVMDVRVHQVMWLTLIASLLLRALLRRPLPLAVPPRWVTASLVGLSAWQLVSAFVNGGGVRSVVEVAQIGYFSVVLWLLAATVPALRPERRDAILRVMAVVWIVLFLASFAYFASGADLPVETTYKVGTGLSFRAMYTKVTASDAGGLQRMGMFGHPAVSTASFLSGLPAALLAIALTARRPRDRALAWALFGCSSFVLLLTFSRAGWLVCILMIVAIGWRMGKGALLWLFLALSVGAVVLLAVPQVAARVEDFTNAEEGSTKSHVKLWTRAIEYANASPVFGDGPYSFSERSRNPVNGQALPVHNFALEAAAETGWVGAAFTVAFVLALLVWGWRRVGTGPPIVFSLLTGFLATVLMAVTMNGFREDAIWVWAGLLVGAAAFGARRESAQPAATAR